MFRIFRYTPNQQFSVDGYKIDRRDINSFDGGLLFYVNENMPCRELTAERVDCHFVHDKAAT